MFLRSRAFPQVGCYEALVAQGIERRFPKPCVAGSNPAGGTRKVRVYGGIDPATGKARQLSRTVRGSVKDANALRAQLLIEVERKGAGGSTHTLACCSRP